MVREFQIKPYRLYYPPAGTSFRIHDDNNATYFRETSQMSIILIGFLSYSFTESFCAYVTARERNVFSHNSFSFLCQQSSSTF